MPTQADKGRAFAALHQRDHAFLAPNPFNIGTAKILASLGFEALASTSMGYAFTQGRPDYGLTRDEVFAHLRILSNATDLPVSADLENGFGPDPKTVAETIRLSAETGIVGGSIEDSTGNPDAPIYPFDEAVTRVKAAVEAARALPFTYTLTARCENYLHGREDLADTIARLKAYEDAGADVLYAPGLETRDDITAVVKALKKPVNVLGVFTEFSVDELSAMGVRRITVGSSPMITAMSAFYRAAQEMKEHGTFAFVKGNVPSSVFAKIYSS